MLPLLKIPFILAASYGVTVTYTNPNPSITEDERRPKDSRSSAYLRFMVKNMPYVRGMFWLVGLAEIAAILLVEARSVSSAPGHQVLRILLPKGTVNDLNPTPGSMIGVLLIVAGSWLRLECYRALDKFFTFEITIRDNHKLVTSGPYSFVRHPSYTATAVLFIGQCLWYGSRGSWLRDSSILDTKAVMAVVGTFAAMYMKLVVNLMQRVPEEDRLMKASFGKEWEEWARKVPYGLFPGIY